MHRSPFPGQLSRESGGKDRLAVFLHQPRNSPQLFPRTSRAACEAVARNDNLDVSWLRDTEAEAEEHLTEPEDIATAIMGHLKAALEEIETVSDELTEEEVEAVDTQEKVA